MSTKREDYISWDEYFMSVRIIRFYLWAITDSR